jgi:predicted DNA-binding transcriptional regulator YafY
MLNAEISEESINDKAKPKGLNVSKHRKQSFFMYSGKTEKVRFEADRDMLDVIYDKFGENTRIICLDEKRISFSAEIEISPVFFGWCCSFSDRLKVVGPIEAIGQMKAHLDKIEKIYRTKDL